jgi:hypothetical protein
MGVHETAATFPQPSLARTRVGAIEVADVNHAQSRRDVSLVISMVRSRRTSKTASPTFDRARASPRYLDEPPAGLC